MSRAAVLVLGAPLRGDDAVGPLVGERLRAAGVDVHECGDDPTRLVERLAGVDLAVVVDAVRSGQAPGTVHRIDGRADALAGGPGGVSTHSIGLAAAIDLAEALGALPRRVVVIGVEGERFAIGDAPTPAVSAAVPQVVEEVMSVLGER